jgi:hypothetical protein
MPGPHTHEKKRLTRITVRDAIIAVAFIAGLIGVAILLARQSSNQETDAGRIYGELPFDAAQADLAFQARVAAAFPLQTREDALVRSLSSEGFREASPRRMVFRRWVNRRSLTCGFDASVAWEADNSGRVTALEAHYLRALGCIEKK